MEIKITPFVLFLILLITLVISMIFGNSFIFKKNKEGFVSFGYTNYDTMKVHIPQYSADTTKKVIYLYDNLYFDGRNANLIEVDSAYCGNVRVNGSSTNGNIECNDRLGTSITNIYVTTRDGNTESYPTLYNSNEIMLSRNTSESNIDMEASNTDYSYLSKCDTISEMPGFKYQLFYVSWENDTYMHLIGLDQTFGKGHNIRSMYYNNSNNIKYVDFTQSHYIPGYLQSPLPNEDSNNGKIYHDEIYKKNIYQISKYVKYDIVSGYVIVSNPSEKTYNVYNRSNGTVVTNTNRNSLENITSFISWIVPDNNNGMVLIMAHGINTLIMIINSIPGKSQYRLSYCTRFTDTEVHISSNSSSNLNINSFQITDASSNTHSQPCYDELSCKWYYYFKTIGNDPSVLFKNDFIRKTQIVPPVCPRCPSCTKSGVCTNCGGNGGAGSKDSNGNIIEDAAKGTVNLGKDVVGGAVDLGKDVVGGTVGLVKDTVGGAVGLVKDTASGIVNLGRNNDSRKIGVTNDVANEYLPNNSSADRYSYYGALQSKGGNFMPVTADFSSFRK